MRDPKTMTFFSEGKMQRLREVYVEKLRRIGTDAGGIEAVETYFDEMNRRVRWVEEQRRKVEPSHLTSLLTFAEKAYRRPLAPSERDGFMAFYRELRTVEMLSHEDAIRDVVVNVLMSPHFCYRFDLPSAGKAAQPLAGYSLASRLSYFLWSTMPDEELLAQAAAGNLQRSEILRAQTKRMLIDPRVRGLATEFGGNWLGFRYFQQHNSVDRGRFESFTDELRDALFEEPIRFFMDAVHHDRSILEFLYATHTFVNSVLARHYGMPKYRRRIQPVVASRRGAALRARWPITHVRFPDRELAPLANQSGEARLLARPACARRAHPGASS